MKPLIALLTLLTLAAAGRAETVARIPVLVDAVAVIGKMEATRTLIASTSSPKLRSYKAYIVRGEVMFDNVDGDARIVFWGDDGSPVGLSLGTALLDSGNVISGTSDWRPFAASIERRRDRPIRRIDIEVSMPGKGIIRLQNVTLSLYPHYLAISPWWSSRTSGLIGAAVGTSMGILGAMVGVFGARGKGRRLMVVGFAIGMATGAACLLVGLVALFSRQPYSVWYPLLLTGGLLCITLPVIAMVIRKAQTQQELNRMRAADMG